MQYKAGAAFTIQESTTLYAIWEDIKSPEISIKKEITSGDKLYKVGDVISYKVTVSADASGGDVSGVLRVTDTLAGKTGFVNTTASTSSVTYNVGSKVWSITSLTHGNQVEITYNYTVQDSDLAGDNEQITNIAAVEEKNDSAIAKLAHSELTVEKTANVEDGEVNVGDLVSYTITVKNSGNAAAEGVTVTDVLPEGLSNMLGKHEFTWDNVNVPAQKDGVDGEWSVTLEGVLVGAGTEGKELINVANAIYDNQTIPSNEAKITVNGAPKYTLTVEKKVEGDTEEVLNGTLYSFTISYADGKGDSFELADGGSKKFEDIPAGAKVTVTENVSEDAAYTVRGTNPKTFTMTGDRTVTFVNYYEEEEVPPTPEVPKYHYSLTYHTNYGDGSDVFGETETAEDAEIHHDFTIKSEIPSRTGYDFLGWSLNADNSSGLVGDKVTAYGIQPDIDLYAIWKELEVTITYEVAGEGGNVSPTSETIGAVNGVAEGSTATAEDGYVFENWTNEAGGVVGTNAKFVPTAKDENDLNVEAKYIAHFAEDANGDGTADKYQDVVIKVKGDQKEETYDGTEKNAAGYDIVDVTIGGKSVDPVEVPTGVSITSPEGISVSETDAGEYAMNLAEKLQVLKEGSYNSVQIVVVEDGWLHITPRKLTISAKRTLPYTGSTYDLTVEYPSDDWDFTPKGLVEPTDALAAFTYHVGGLAGPNTFTHQYTLTQDNIVKNGDNDVTGNYDIELNVTVTFTKGFDVTTHASMYDGTEHKNIEVRDADGNLLTEGEDYEVDYSGSDLVNAGTVTATVKGKDGTPYAGTVRTANYEITKRRLTLRSEDASWPYDGNEHAYRVGTIDGLVEGENAIPAPLSFATIRDVGTKENSFEVNWGDVNQNNYEIVRKAFGTLEITAAPLTEENVEVDGLYDIPYDGELHKESANVWATDGEGRKLIEGDDYIVSYDTYDFTNAHKITVTITFKGDYSGTVTRTYAITPRPLTLHFEGTLPYNGQEQTLFASDVPVTAENLVDGESVELTASITGKEVGDHTDLNKELKYTISSGNDNYIVDVTGKLTITPADPAVIDPRVTLEDWTYGGTAKDPTSSVTWKDGGNVEGYGTPNYTYYKDGVQLDGKPTDAGKYTVRATWAATDSLPEVWAEDPFQILKADLKVKITGNHEVVTYNGNDQIVSGYTIDTLPEGVTVTLIGTAEVHHQDVTVEWPDGHYPMNLTADQFTVDSDNYNVELDIEDGWIQVDPAELEVKVSAERVYNGDTQKVEWNASADGVTVNGLVDGQKLNFTASMSGKEVGTYPFETYETLNVFDSMNKEATRNYKVHFSGELKITKPSDTDIQATVTMEDWVYGEEHPALSYSAKLNDTVQYGEPESIVYVAENPSGFGTEETSEVEPKDVGDYIVSVTWGGTDDLPRVQAEAHFSITKRPVTLTSGTKEKTYDGKPLTDETVTTDEGEYGFAEGEGAIYSNFNSITEVGTDANTFEYTLKDNTKASNYEIQVKYGTLTVTQADAANVFQTSDVPTDYMYDGKEHKWVPTVTDKNGNTLTENTDYTVTYSTENFVNAGTITVTIQGEGNYSGTITRSYKIAKRPIFLLASGEFTYDGQEHTVTAGPDNTVDWVSQPDWETRSHSGEYYPLVAGDVIADVFGGFSNSATGWTNGYGKSVHPVTNYVKIVNGNGDVTSNYTGYLQVNVIIKKAKATVTITGMSGSTEYNGSGQSLNGYTIDGLIEDEMTLHGPSQEDIAVTGTDAGSYTVDVESKAFNVSSENYIVTVEKKNGEFTINKKAATVKSASDEKEYDGTPLTNGEVTFEGFVDGEGVTGTATGSQLTVGSSGNPFTYEANEGTDLDNYEITEVEGTLTVTDRTEKYVITVQANGGTATYDGQDHSVSGLVTDTFVVNGNTYTVSGLDASASGTDASEYTATVTGTAVVTDAAGNDVTAQFTVNTEAGTLTINKRTVTLTSATASKNFDGRPLTNDEITVGGQGFVEGEGATYTVTGSQTVVGSSANEFTYALNENTKADNYEISTTAGILSVNPRTGVNRYRITVTANSDSAVYDGAAHRVDGYTMTTTTFNGITYTVSGITASSNDQYNAGVYPVSFTGTPVVRDAAGHDVSANFIVTLINGTLTITAPGAPAPEVPAPAVVTPDVPGPGGTTPPAGPTAPVGPAAPAGPAAVVPGVVIPDDGTPLAGGPDADAGDAGDDDAAGGVIIEDDDTPLAGGPGAEDGVEIGENETPMGLMDDVIHECCILHLFIMLASLLVTVYYTHNRKKHQEDQFDMRRELTMA